MSVFETARDEWARGVDIRHQDWNVQTFIADMYVQEEADPASSLCSY
jgi:hypothetical protein